MFLELNKNLSSYSKVDFLNTSAEKTDISSHSCDAIVVGTAFHWFEKDKFRAECDRILKNERYIAILRICNNTDGDKKMDKINHHTEQDLEEAKAFFGSGFIEHVQFEYAESFDEERYINNLLSSAYRTSQEVRFLERDTISHERDITHHFSPRAQYIASATPPRLNYHHNINTCPRHFWLFS